MTSSTEFVAAAKVEVVENPYVMLKGEGTEKKQKTNKKRKTRKNKEQKKD